MKFRWISLALVAILFTSQVRSQQSIPGHGAFQLDLDLARFFGSDSTVYVEAYYGIPEHLLTYQQDPNGYAGGVVMSMRIVKDSTVLDRKDWKVPHVIADTSTLASGKTMVGVEAFSVSQGTYTFQFIATDLNNGLRRDSVSIPLTIKPFPPSQESFSDLELCTTIAPAADSGGMFFKNTLDVVPNPSMLYGPGLPFLNYYVEMYRLTNPAHSGDAILTTTITSGNGEQMYSQSRHKTRKYPSIVEQGKVKIASWRGGTYTLRLVLSDTLNNTFASVARKFFIYRPGQVDTPAAIVRQPKAEFATSEFALLTEEQVNREFAVSRYIASEPERKIWDRLSELEAKRRFMFEFWKNRNTDSVGGKNTTREEYMRRVSYADEHFEKGLRTGWKSDRGRVYVIYGPPDEVEEHSSTAESNPYVIWSYNAIQGGVIFVFVDRSGHGQYVQVHSTHRNELQNQNWYAQTAARAE